MTCCRLVNIMYVIVLMNGYIGGAGNKMLCVAEGIAHCYVYPSSGKIKYHLLGN